MYFRFPPCRFLAGSAATLAAVYDLLAAGRPWHEAFSAEELPGALLAS